MKDICIQTELPPSSRYRSTYGSPSGNKIGLVLSVAAHVLVFWLIFTYKSDLIRASKEGAETVLMLVAPETTRKPAAAPAPAPVIPKRTPRTITSKDAPAIIVPEIAEVVPAPLPTKAEPIRPPPEEDMSAMVEAARRRRNQNREPSQESEETEAQRANRIARANIAAAGNAGNSRNDSGGVFQIRRIGVVSGEFAFNGWSTRAGRKASQLIDVRVEEPDDIQVAMVKKMIEIIRSEKTGEFEWDSHRLGRIVTMNAAPQYRAELTRFLLKEFFPDYVPSRR